MDSAALAVCGRCGVRRAGERRGRSCWLVPFVGWCVLLLVSCSCVVVLVLLVVCLRCAFVVLGLFACFCVCSTCT
ncbi:hypothetical protein POJ06DRAFT_262015 [Lipomyces tetrasporus]|uniref:Uncharacterized protein n=1 Tax=Lipomyces tetrasporus TaxID=54092 RepID=A0AAD7VPY1_9ASCO|nr:uncharacterized protein POJ06DRAFT_262015 [Lipomyces tetrasporus]KAJ8096939.1 hypothetical protein POJ06DRAFT_262015 [Lipomyces tetrasporus]